MTDTKLEDLVNECNGLDALEKAKLVKHLLGDSSISITIGSLSAESFYQINLATPDQMASILQAIADKISSKKT